MALPDVSDRRALSDMLAEVSIEVLSDPEPVGDAYGFASLRAGVAIGLPDGGRADAVVKVWEPEPVGFDEIVFYEEWASKLPVRLPQHFGSLAAAEYGLLVLEDLRPLRQGDEETPLAVHDAQAVSRLLARIHAATTDSESDLPPPRSGRILPPEWHDTRRVSYNERFGLPQEPSLRAVVVHSETAARIGHALCASAPKGLTHSDVHSDNLVFLEEGPVLLDWARIGWGPTVHDLASLLFSSVRLEDQAVAIDAYREIVGVSDDQVHGAMLMRLVVATLGIARWLPSNDRQERLVRRSLARATAMAQRLMTLCPDLVEELR